MCLLLPGVSRTKHAMPLAIPLELLGMFCSGYLRWHHTTKVGEMATSFPIGENHFKEKLYMAREMKICLLPV